MMKRFLRIGGGCLVTAALLVAALAGLTKVLESQLCKIRALFRPGGGL